MDPTNGNRADEQGQFESGADFRAVNTSTLPASGPILDVAVSGTSDLVLKPSNPPRPIRSLGVVHSDKDLLLSQITDDPQMTTFMVPNVGQIETGRQRMQAVSSRREQLVWYGIDSQNMSAALGDRIIVRRDLLESEYVCRECKGKGHADETCPLCEGKQQKEGTICKECLCLGFESDKPRPSGFRKCKSCVGSGWRNGIIIPEVAQGKPVTGVVVSVGPEAKLLKLGDRVLHSKFAGHTLEMKNETYTYMREHEVISLLRDLS